MDIEITVHLKSGEEIVFGYYDEKIQCVAECYAKFFTDEESKVLLINNEKKFQIIPRDNIASICVLEVC